MKDISQKISIDYGKVSIIMPSFNSEKFIEESTRFYNCQFIISTHSPFLLGLKFAKIYNLDSIPVVTQKWNELPNVLTYYNFFKENEKEFKN